jgi:NAD-dependent deacetylase
MNSGEQKIINAAGWIANARYLVAFTGAGISVESGIPPFRGEEGLWSKYDPKALDISYFTSNPSDSWRVIFEIFYHYFLDARPNPAHKLLAMLESKEILKSVITQNIDNLHQEAGSKTVIEYHGNSKHLICNTCGRRTPVTEIDFNVLPPRCHSDQSILKPDFVFYGEPIPEEAAHRAVKEVHQSDILLIIGTTGEVIPANRLPGIAKSGGARIIEINPEPSEYTHYLTDLFLQGKAGDICSRLESYLF